MIIGRIILGCDEMKDMEAKSMKNNNKGKFFKKKGTKNSKTLSDDAIAHYLQTRHEVDEFLRNYDGAC